MQKQKKSFWYYICIRNNNPNKVKTLFSTYMISWVIVKMFLVVFILFRSIKLLATSFSINIIESNHSQQMKDYKWFLSIFNFKKDLYADASVTIVKGIL